MTTPPTPPPQGGPPESEPPGVEDLGGGVQLPQLGFLSRKAAAFEAEGGLIKQAGMPKDQRLASVKARLADTHDKSVVAANKLSERLSSAQSDSDPVEISDTEAAKLGLESGGSNTKGEVLRILRSSITESGEGGPHDIFTPASKPDADIGRKRADGENRYVHAQATFVSLAVRYAQAGELGLAVNAYAQAGLRLDKAPDWFMTVFAPRVLSPEVLKDRGRLEALVGIADSPLLAPAGEQIEAILKAGSPESLPVAHQIWRSAQEAKIALRELMVKEAADAKQRAIDDALRIKKEQDQKAIEQKRKKHRERSGTIEGDTYQAAIELGRLQTQASLEKGIRGWNTVDVMVPIRGETFRVPFNLIMRNSELQNIVNASLDRNATLPVVQLDVFRLLSQNPTLFELTVQTIAGSSNLEDWTGYTLADYQEQYGEEDGRYKWGASWRFTLQRVIDGYAIGVMEQAPGYQVDGAAGDSRRLELFQSAYSVLFGDLNILEEKQLAGINPWQVQALTRIDQYGTSLAEKDSESAIFKRWDGFFNADNMLVTLKNANTACQRAKELYVKELRSHETLLQQLRQQDGEVRKALADVDALRDGEIEDAREYLEAVGILQTFNLPAALQDARLAKELRLPPGIKMDKSLIVIDTNKQKPSITIKPDIMVKINEAQAKAAERMNSLEASKADSTGWRAARNTLLQINSFHDFLDDLGKKLDDMNGNIYWEERKGIGASRMVYHDSDFLESIRDMGNVSPRRPDMEKQWNAVFGSNGMRVGVVTGFKELKQQLDLALENPPRADRREVLKKLEEFRGREINMLVREAENAKRAYSLSKAIPRTVEMFVHEKIHPEVLDKHMLSQGAY